MNVYNRKLKKRISSEKNVTSEGFKNYGKGFEFL